MKKTALNAAIGLLLGVASVTSYAATVNSGDTLTITAGVTTYDSAGIPIGTTGSYFGLDPYHNLTITPQWQTAISQGSTGLVIGTTTAAGASHSGAPVAGDTNAIDAPWVWYGDTGSDYLTVAVTGSTTNGLNLSGWTITWNGGPAIPLGSGAWQPVDCSTLGCTGHTFTDGNAMFTWDGIYGDAYSLNYAATVPGGDPSGFVSTLYYLHLEGVVKPVPLPAAIWLLGSGLLGLVGFAKRKRSMRV
ncbi:MAG: VPLPA-CTERM sorting domain-containing protein [Acidiferrobacterales bacterium]